MKKEESDQKAEKNMLDSTKPWIGLRLNMHIVLKLNYTVAHKEMCS